jgi:diguanylate cyclase (GGDEF)-like protein
MTSVPLSAGGYPLPAAEDERLGEVLAFGLMEGAGAGGLVGICELARSLFGVAGVMVTAVGRDEVRVLAAAGATPAGHARRDSLCAWTIAADGGIVVEDAARDPRFARQAHEPPIRFYAGAPLTLRPGVALGALALVDPRPRAFSAEEAVHLRMLAGLALAELRNRRDLVELARREALVTRAAHLTKVGSFAHDLVARRTTWSPETARIIGVPDAVGPSWERLIDYVVDGETQTWARQALQDLLDQGASIDREIQLSGPLHVAPRWVRVLAEAERSGGEIVRVVGSVQDVTDRREAEARIERLAYRDPLTDLPNRTLFQQKVAAAVDAAARRGGKLGLILLDLDHFKDVNDTIGHEAGDALLRSVADRLNQAYRKTDTVARLGGDEFAVILPSINEAEDLTRPTETVMALLRRPLQHDGETLSITASVGYALYPDRDDDAAQLLKNAEIALFRAKAEGRNRIVAYTPQMRVEVEQRTELLREVREALTRGEFELHYQPIAETVPAGVVGRTVGFEALARWSHPTRGLLSPETFMTAFDDPELSLQLGEATLEEALRQMRAWTDAGVAFGRVAVNASAAQFRTGRLAEIVLEKLDRWGVPAERLCIEVTENVYMGWGAEVVGDACRALHAAGVLVALDDFGTGYASLTHLKSFPIDRLKIDRSFCQAEDDRAIVRAVANLGHSLGMQVVAEGVEDPAQLAALREAGCDLAQGWWIGRPLPAASVPAHLAETSKKRPALRLA